MGALSRGRHRAPLLTHLQNRATRHGQGQGHGHGHTHLEESDQISLMRCRPLRSTWKTAAHASSTVLCNNDVSDKGLLWIEPECAALHFKTSQYSNDYLKKKKKNSQNRLSLDLSHLKMELESCAWHLSLLVCVGSAGVCGVVFGQDSAGTPRSTSVTAPLPPALPLWPLTPPKGVDASIAARAKSYVSSGLILRVLLRWLLTMASSACDRDLSVQSYKQNKPG